MDINVILNKFGWNEVELEDKYKNYADMEVENKFGKTILLRVCVKEFDKSKNGNSISILFQKGFYQIKENKTPVLYQAVQNIPDDVDYYQIYGFLSEDKVKKLVILDLKKFVQTIDMDAGNTKEESEFIKNGSSIKNDNLYIPVSYNKNRTASYISFKAEQLYEICPDAFYYVNNFYTGKKPFIFCINKK